MATIVQTVVQQVIDEQVSEINEDAVAVALAADIVKRGQFEIHPQDAIEAGVEAAIDEIDDKIFDAAFEMLQAAVSEEVERQAKTIALRMIRDLAATAAREAAAAE